MIRFSKNQILILHENLINRFGGVVGIRDELQYEVLTEATLHNVTMADGKPLSLAENDLIAIKVTMRLGFAVVQPNLLQFLLLLPDERSVCNGF